MVMNRKTKALLGQNIKTPSSVGPDNFSPTTLHGKLSSSFQAKEFESTAAPSQLSFLPLTQKWTAMRVSKSSSTKNSPKKPKKSRPG